MANKLSGQKCKRVKKKWYDNGIRNCTYCNKLCDFFVKDGHPDKATIDHKTPRVLGGSNRKENLVLSCLKCNSQKGSKGYEEFSLE